MSSMPPLPGWFPEISTEQQVMADSLLPTDEKRLACPFCKRFHEKHVRIDGPCTMRFGFASISKVNEHLKREHSLKFGCLKWKKRFPHCNNLNIDEKKKDHKCVERDFNESDSIWMDADQEKRHSNWSKGDDADRQDDVVKKWNDIYKSLFCDAEGNIQGPYPNPCEFWHPPPASNPQRRSDHPVYDYLEPAYRVRLEGMRERIMLFGVGFDGNNFAPNLLSQVNAAIQVNDCLANDFRAIQSAFQQINDDVMYEQQRWVAVLPRSQGPNFTSPKQSIHQSAAHPSLAPMLDRLAQPGNANMGSLDPSLGSSPYSLDHDNASLKRRKVFHETASWSIDARQSSDSGYGSGQPCDDTTLSVIEERFLERGNCRP